MESGKSPRGLMLSECIASLPEMHTTTVHEVSSARTHVSDLHLGALMNLSLKRDENALSLSDCCLTPVSQLSTTRAGTSIDLPSVASSPRAPDANLVAIPLQSHAGACSSSTSLARTLSLPPVAFGRQLKKSPSYASRGKVGLTVTITARFAEAEISIDLGDSQAEQLGKLPSPLPFEVPAIAEIRGTGSIMGVLRVNGVPEIPFGIQTGAPKPTGERANFVSAEGKQRTVVSHGEHLQAGSGFSVKGEGTVVEVSVSDGYFAEMMVIIRRAKKKELTRIAQTEALVNAMEKRKYSSLLAQITKARTRKVEIGLIDQAERVLKGMKLPESAYLNHKELSKLMRWKRITTVNDGNPTIEDCPGSSDCPCNAGQAEPGEELTVVGNVVQQVLEDVAPPGVPPDKWLFQALVRAAYTVPEGCVWKSGGKFILSNEERNQAVSSIVALLERDNQESDASKGIRALLGYTEKEYDYRVTAIQINFHPNEKTYHKQHRDIHGSGQKGGTNCTCSFIKAQGTVCFSLGSSRQVLCETITDSQSKYTKCCEECTGRKVYHWLDSGSAMMFNSKWNANHTHGIPVMTELCGPRISVALLCA